MDEAGIAMVEQPLPFWTKDGMAALCSRLRMAVVADEGLWDLHDAYAAFKSGATALYGVKTGKGGGIRRAYKAASVAEAAGIPIYGGMALESSIGTAAALQLFSALPLLRSEEHTSELQSLMRISYAVFCLKKKKKKI